MWLKQVGIVNMYKIYTFLIIIYQYDATETK